MPHFPERVFRQPLGFSLFGMGVGNPAPSATYQAKCLMYQQK
jgi:hypothetical protein